MKSSRKPTPVQVVYFPKKAARTTSRTQTIPELFLGDDLKTEEVAVGDVKRSRRRSRSGSQPRVTLSEEMKAPEQDEARAGMAALGHELFSLGRVAEAKVIFQGLATSASDAFTFTMLGTIHLAEGEHDRALACFEQALVIDPEELAALVYRAEIRLHKKRFRQALDDLQRAEVLGPPDEPFVERARRLMQLARRAMKR
jgi:tetratricopeptide (TPR) repeat protein